MREEVKTKVFELKTALGGNYQKLCTMRGADVYFYNVSPELISFWGYGENGRWIKNELTWEDLTEQDFVDLQNGINKIYPEKVIVERDSYKIKFYRPSLNESIICNLKDQKFTKVYTTGKERDIKYPHTFFRGYEGRLVVQDIPSDDNFNELMSVITKKEYLCSNFGTFLVRMFDNIHLETYIAVKKKFDNRISVPYNYFDKDVRKILDGKEMSYTPTVENFFADKNIGKSLIFAIKDRPDFVKAFNWISKNMRDIQNLVENYNYDVRSLWSYWEKRNFKSDPTRKGDGFGYNDDIVSYFMDYVRMASAVYAPEFINQYREGALNIEVEQGDEKSHFPKYPKDLKRAHDYVQTLHQAYKAQIDEKVFEQGIDLKLEWKKGDYQMIHPKKSIEIIYEGKTLNHCVGSYVERVVKGETRILFLRSKENLAEPLVTIELRNGSITQAKGNRNRQVSYDEKTFLEEYAKEKRLNYSVGRYY